MQSSSRPALFLDRDGVINVDRGYVSRRADFEWQPGIFEVARTAVRLGLLLVVVTNQSGIGRGYYTEQDFQALTAFMRQRFADEAAELTAVYHCPFHPEAERPEYRAPDHSWRKPRPGMILAARDDLGIDLARSALVGDRWVDMQAGATAGVGALAVIGRDDPTPPGLPSVRRLARVAEVSDWLVTLAKASHFTRNR